MIEELESDLGADIHSDWDFKDGDLKIISDESNICQSIANRLNNPNGTFDLYYNEYGSFLLDFIGWKASEDTLQFIQMEIEETLKQDERFEEIQVNLEYTGKGKLKGNINITYNDGNESTFNLEVNEQGEAEIEVDEDGN